LLDHSHTVLVVEVLSELEEVEEHVESVLACFRF